MEMTIDVNDYLQHDEIRDIVASTIKRQIAEMYSNEQAVKRMMTNQLYDFVYELVNRHLDGDAETAIKEHALKQINNINFYHIFRQKDIWNNDESLGWRYLQEAMRENKDLIAAKVRETIEGYDYTTLTEDEVREAVINVIDSRLFVREEEAHRDH